MSDKIKGVIFSIMRGSLHDGAGIRTVVYFKGCTLRCAWCHNPEGIRPGGEIMLYADKCIGCGRCAKVCPKRHTADGFIREGCTACGRCAEVCPNGALIKCGSEYDAGELFDIIARDRHYYELSGGGVTFSGGECFMQPELLRETAKKCKSAGINTAAESALSFDGARLCTAVEYIDSMFVDLKHMNSDAHRLYTGGGNELILKNLRFLSENHGDITVRIPLIPNVNDGDENLSDSADFINSCGDGILRVELLKYNNLAANKYTALGCDAGFDAVPQTDERMCERRDFLRHRLKSRIVVC